MEVSIETTKGLERRMKVAIPAERIENEVKQRLQSLTRTVKLAGFRPGKVPINVVRSKYGTKIHQEVLDEVTRSSFQEAIVQQKLQPAGAPQIELQTSEPGKGLEYTAVFEVFPGIELAALDTIKVDSPVAEITEKDVDNMLERMRQQRIEWQAVERPAALKDQLLIDFVGTINGEPFAGNEAKELTLVLGTNSFIEGFEDKLVGATTDSQHSLALKFPDDYHVESLAAKPVQFEVKVHTVSEPKLPEIDDSFARSFGVESGDVAAFRIEIRDGMQREMEQVIKDKTKQSVMDGLYEANKIELPKAMVEGEIDSLIEQTKSMLKSQGAQLPNKEVDRSLFEDRAKRRVALGLIISELVQKNSFKTDPAKVRVYIENLASGYENPEEMVRWYYADRSRLSQVESLVLEQQVVDYIVDNSNISGISTTFDEVMKDRRV